MLFENPTPEGFVSTAKRDICSDNDGGDLATEKILAAVDHVDEFFEKQGHYKAIKNSRLYTDGINSHV
jgi:hypothetical protein